LYINASNRFFGVFFLFDRFLFFLTIPLVYVRNRGVKILM
jgi:hypothetical protein